LRVAGCELWVVGCELRVTGFGFAGIDSMAWLESHSHEQLMLSYWHSESGSELRAKRAEGAGQRAKGIEQRAEG
jgi:hypothetical protein